MTVNDQTEQSTTTPLLDAESPTFLYRFYDRDGVLLYVGITFNPSIRWHHHKGKKGWWSDVERIEATRYPNRHQAEAEEVRVIQEESPLYNIIHAVRPDPQEDFTSELDEAIDALEQQARRSAGTPRRTIRIDDDLWGRFSTAAEDVNPTERGKESGTSVVLRDFMRWYVGEKGSRMPRRPPRPER